MDGATVFERIKTLTCDTQGIVELFCQHLEDVFSHVYHDIIQFLRELDENTLINIRNENISGIISTKDYELKIRRKRSILEDDIYVLGFSLVD